MFALMLVKKIFIFSKLLIAQEFTITLIGKALFKCLFKLNSNVKTLLQHHKEAISSSSH